MKHIPSFESIKQLLTCLMICLTVVFVTTFTATDQGQAATDYFLGRGASADGVVAITPHDSTDIDIIPRQVYFEVGGTVSLVMKDGTTATLTVPNQFAPAWRIKRINDTGTDDTVEAFAFY